ncbi:MAG: AbrB/MazE/SpoVT family DNA-binding domain-containing protein [Thermoplasmatota archaeon]
MLVRTLKVSDKGQITLPADALASMNARRGSEFVLIQEDGRIVLIKAESVGKQILDELGGWEALAAPAFAEVWDNEADSVWDDA